VVDLPEPDAEPAKPAARELPPPRPVLPAPTPELPQPRLRLAAAVREGDQQALAAVLERAARLAPEWDAEAELTQLQTTRRQRRRSRPPAWLRWLARIVHTRRPS
jgi:hypothetical protein